jgi:membrane-associated phospholipid phosphatase
MTGIPCFDRFYGQASEGFGALPSMHCAYPMLLMLFAWEMRCKSLTVALLAYQILMAFSAVYLQHHYVTDVIAGILFALLGYALGRAVASTLPAVRLTSGPSPRGRDGFS